jgi:hypothetical protein
MYNPAAWQIHTKLAASEQQQNVHIDAAQRQDKPKHVNTHSARRLLLLLYRHMAVASCQHSCSKSKSQHTPAK